MNTKRDLQELWTATAEAARESNVLRFRPDPSPCPGDTFVFRETADYPVEWVIVERDQADVRRLLVVPLDAYPQIGSQDVGLHLDEPGRVAHIRCDVDAWLAASSFHVEHRTGELSAESIALIRHKRDAIAAGGFETTLLEEKVDGDPEYRRWKDETLHGALSALPASGAAAEEPATIPPVRTRTSMRWLYPAAASVVLVVGAFWGFRQMEEMERLRDELVAKGEEVVAMEQAKGELEEDLATAGDEVESLRGEVEATAQELAERGRLVSDLRQDLAASPSGVDRNHPVYALRDGRNRGRFDVRIPEGKPRLTLVVEVIDAEYYERYRLEIVDKLTDDTLVWSSDDMRLRGSDLTLSVPSSLLDEGEYDLRLYGIAEDGRAVKLAENYLLDVWKTSR